MTHWCALHALNAPEMSEASFFSNTLFAAGGLTVTLYKWNKRHPQVQHTDTPPGHMLSDNTH